MNVRKLSTGDVALFDTKKRELIVVPKSAAKGALTWAKALALVDTGTARHYNKASLKALTEALRNVILLGA